MKSARNRRGSMYLAVLMTAMIVAVVGVSALTAARLQLQASEGGNNLAAARCYAQSAIEFGLKEISGNPNWRTSYAHDEWRPDQTLAYGVISWKLVDDVNGSLTADISAPVRIYGRGAAGDVERVFSVLFNDGAAAVPNLLTNAGFEGGETDWAGSFGCEVEAKKEPHHEGAKSLLIKNRSNWFQGAKQEVTDKLENGVTYEIEAWVQPKDSSVTVRFFMYLLNDHHSSQYPQVDSVLVLPDEWTLATAEMTPSWTGTLIEAYLIVATGSGDQDFYIDDAVLREKVEAADITLAAGTWRRDVGESEIAEQGKGEGTQEGK